MKILTKRQILLLHTALIGQSGGSDGIRDAGLLDSAIHAPFQTFADQNCIHRCWRRLRVWDLA